MQVVSLPHVDTAARWTRPRLPRQIRATTPFGEQLGLFAPSILRRRAVRTRKAVAFVAIDGSRSVRWSVDTVPLSEVATGRARDHGADGTFTVRQGYVGLDSRRYRDDDVAQDFVVRHPEGASLSEVAEALRLGKSTVDDVERRAMTKLLARARAGDRDVRRWFFALAQHIGLDRIAGEFDDEEEDEDV